MSENAFTVVNSGQEVQDGDVTQLGVTGGLSDDHVLAEFLRMPPINGSTVSKVVIPYSVAGNTTGTVSTTHSANGSILISPFRAICGARNAPAGSPIVGNITTDSDALASWRDIRSGVFVGSATTLTQTLALAPNSSVVFARWDLVYAAITPDANGPSVARRVKNPSTSAVAVTNVPEYIYSPVTVAVVTGTVGATPALPTLPADGAGLYYIPLAYVRVPASFSSSNTISTRDIRATTQGVSSFANLSESFDCGVANGNNDENANFNSGGPFAWVPGTVNSRPGPWMPPDWTGGVSKIAQVDNLTSPPYSHESLDVVDSSIDWRNRHVVVFSNYATSPFGTDPTATGPTPTVPGGASANAAISFGNSITTSSSAAGGSSTVWFASIGGVSVALLVQASTGHLLWSTSGTVGQRFAFWIMASGQMPNA